MPRWPADPPGGVVTLRQRIRVLVPRASATAGSVGPGAQDSKLQSKQAALQGAYTPLLVLFFSTV